MPTVFLTHTPDMLAKDFAAKWVGKVDNAPTAPQPTVPAGPAMTLPGAPTAPAGFDLKGPVQLSAAAPAAGSDGASACCA